MKLPIPRWTQVLHPKSWGQGRSLVFLLFVGLSLIFALGSRSPLAELMDKNFSLAAAFKGRAWLKQSPRLDPRLKIYVFDDQMIELLGREDLSLSEWAILLRAFADAGAAAIYIDKLFGTPHQLGQELGSFEALMEDFPIPVVTAGWLTPQPIRGRIPLDPTKSGLGLKRLQLDPLALPDWLQRPKEQWFYGPHVLLHRLLSQVGHAIYRGQGEIDPVYRTHPEALIPHWSLQGPVQLQAAGQSLWVQAPGSNPARLPLTREHRLLVNFLPEADLRDASYSLRNAYLRAQEGVSFASSLQAGQIVVILPAMFTGNTDMVASPIGYIPGGYVMSSLLNSHLTAQWLKPWNYQELSAIFMVGLGVALGTIVSPAVWLIGLGLGTLALGLLLFLAFAFGSIASNSLYHVLAFVSSSVCVFAVLWQLRALRARSEKAHREAMQQTAQAVQAALLPPPQEYRYFRYASYYQAAEATGGDWFGLYPNRDQSRVYVFVGDVTGHGFSSALLTGAVAGAIASQIAQCLEQPRAMAEELTRIAEFINQLVFTIGSRTDRSLTMSFLAFDFAEQQLTYLNAGHPAPLLARQGKVQALTSRGSILGLKSDLLMEVRQISIRSGDSLLLFTDGLFENRGPQGELLKPRSVWEVLKQEQLAPSQQMEEILCLARERWQDQAPADDCTFLILRLAEL